MTNPNFASRAVQTLRRVAGVPAPSTPDLEHPFIRYNPDAEDVVDRVLPPREMTSEELDARAGHLSDAQIAGLRATASIVAPPPVPSTRFGAVNGITGWAGAR